MLRQLATQSPRVSHRETFRSLPAEPGYQLLPGGLILQWGKSSNLASNTSEEITLPLPFPNAVLSLHACPDNLGADIGKEGVATVVSLSKIRVGNNGADADPIWWLALGH